MVNICFFSSLFFNEKQFSKNDYCLPKIDFANYFILGFSNVNIDISAKWMNFNIYLSFSLLFDLSYRIVGNRSKMVHFSITKDCHTVRHIITPNVAHFVLVAASQLPDDVSQPCFANFIPSISYVRFVWNSWTKWVANSNELKSNQINN